MKNSLVFGFFTVNLIIFKTPRNIFCIKILKNMNQKNNKNILRSQSTPSISRSKRSSSNQKKLVKKAKTKSSLKSFFLTEYMKRVIVPDGDDFYCNICVDKPRMQRKNVFRHLVESVTHSNSISKQVDTEGHNELIPKIQEALAKNKRTYNKKSFNTKEEKKDYLKFLIFCQKQNFSFQQISSLGKFLHEMAREKRLRFFEESTFHREEISSVARCFGKCILKNLENDLKNSPYSFTIDSSTVSRRNISALKVKYLKEDFDEQGIRRTTIQNRTIGIKYLKHSTTAKTMYDITNEKLLGLSEEIKSNLVGYVHDHASNLSGIYNGLGALLKSNLKQKIMI